MCPVYNSNRAIEGAHSAREVTDCLDVSEDDAWYLLNRFGSDVGRVLPLTALWAHGSLALGDFQPGRSDIDLVALTAEPIGPAAKRDLQRVHEALIAEVPLADKLHCAYMVGSGAEPGDAELGDAAPGDAALGDAEPGDAALGDASRKHVTWAHGELFDRIVSPVTRRELHQGGLCLLGPSPAGLLPLVSDQELADYIRGDLQGFWYPNTDVAELWLREIWVDLGLLTLARARVTLADGRLITKREALEVLADDGAPADVVRDIFRRRYETEVPVTEEWRARRGLLARTYVQAGIERVLGLPARGVRNA